MRVQKIETTNTERLFEIDGNDEHFLYTWENTIKFLQRKKTLNIVDRKGFEIRI